MAYRGSSLSFGYTLTPWVKRLLIANGAVYLLTWLIPDPSYLALTPNLVLTRPWTLITYMFTHAGFWHIALNMLMLFFFGPPLESRWGSREFLKFYLLCGLGVAALSMIFAWDASIVGASGAVFGVMLAFAMNWPDSPIYVWGIFPVKAKWLVGFLVAITLLSTLGGANDGVAHMAHLGGLLTGFLYLKIDYSVAARLSRLRSRLPNSRIRVVPGEKGAKGSPGAGQPGGSESPGQSPDREQLLDEVDRVLDKISDHGIASLSPDERKVLDEVSRRYRSN